MAFYLLYDNTIYKDMVSYSNNNYYETVLQFIAPKLQTFSIFANFVIQHQLLTFNQLIFTVNRQKMKRQT